MITVSEAIDFLNHRLRFHNSRASKFQKAKPDHAKKHADTAANHVAIIKLLESFAKNPALTDLQADKGNEDVFSLNPLDMDDLPDELREDLNLPRGDLIDAQILRLFEIANRPLTTNEVLVALYRKYQEQMKKNALSARLYRLVKADQLESVENKKGLYQLPHDTQQTLLPSKSKNPEAAND